MLVKVGPGTCNRMANLTKIWNLNFAMSWLSIDIFSVSESLKFYAQRTAVILNESFWNFAYSRAMYWPYWANSKILHITLQSVLDESLKFCTKHGIVLLCFVQNLRNIDVIKWVLAKFHKGWWNEILWDLSLRWIAYWLAILLIAPCVLVFPVALGIIKQF